MGESSEELRKRLKEAGDEMRKDFVFRPGSTNSESGRKITSLKIANATTHYAEAVVAVLLDAMDHYVEAAARDRESAAKGRESDDLDRKSQARNRTAQLVLGVLMLLATMAMVASTVIYTAAARKQTQLMERQLSGTSAASMPAPSLVHVRSAGTFPAPDSGFAQ
jgi:hypothetical protein